MFYFVLPNAHINIVIVIIITILFWFDWAMVRLFCINVYIYISYIHIFIFMVLVVDRNTFSIIYTIHEKKNGMCCIFVICIYHIILHKNTEWTLRNGNINKSNNKNMENSVDFALFAMSCLLLLFFSAMRQ